MFQVKITGMKELKQNMDAVIKELEDAMEGGTQEAADYAEGIVRRNTPVGPTGNLQAAVTTKPLPRKKGYPPNTMVGLDYNIAPHQHLVEFGTAPRYHASGKSVGAHPKPANPFFRTSIDQAKAGIKGRIGDSAKSVIDRRRG